MIHYLTHLKMIRTINALESNSRHKILKSTILNLLENSGLLVILEEFLLISFFIKNSIE